MHSIFSWQFIEYGVEGSILLLQTCLDHLNSYRTDLKNVSLERVLASIFKYLLDKPNFTTVFCESLRNSEINEGILENFSNALHLSVSEKIGLGLALSDSENFDNRIFGKFQVLNYLSSTAILLCCCYLYENNPYCFLGKNFCMAQIEELCGNPVAIHSSEQIYNIIMFLRRCEGLAKFVDSFMQMLSLVHLKDAAPFVLTPLLSDELCEANILRYCSFLNFLSAKKYFPFVSFVYHAKY